MRTVRLITASGVIVALAACAGLGNLKRPVDERYETLLEVVHARENQYFQYSDQFANSTFAYDVGIALLAAGSVAAAVFSHGAAKGNLLAGLGIGAGTATVLWGAYKPGDKRAAYRDAGSRADCVYVNGKALSGASQEMRAARLQSNLDTLDEDVAAVTANLAKAQPLASNQKDVAIILAAHAALQKAQTARDVGVDELNAFASRSVVVWNALVTIDVAADSTSKTVVITLSEAKGAMGGDSGVPKAAGTGTGPSALNALPGVGAAASSDPFVVLQQSTDSLVGDNALITGQKYFSPAIARVKACAETPAVK